MQLDSVALSDKFDLNQSRVFLSGTQALVRLCLMQQALDQRKGLHTAGYVTGYRGSPLGGLDQQFPKAATELAERSIVFEPALNEDLAATALWGAQQAELRGDGKYDGVFGIWYGKGPGVDRSGDVFRHANLAGTSPHGGVLVLMGDDHTCESSTTAHQSEFALVDAMIPILNPVNVSEIIDYGLHGWALSRFAGVWCGLKAVKDNIESTASIYSSLDDFMSNEPDRADHPPEGLNIRTNDPPPEQEARLHRHKLNAVMAYVKANALNQVVWSGGEQPAIGIVSTGKSWLDTLQALEELGVDEARAAELGIRLFKVGMPWPLEPSGVEAFAKGLQLLIVVEEKRALIESQIKTLLYGKANPPAVIGKRNSDGDVLFQSEGALNPIQIAVAVGQHTTPFIQDSELSARSAELRQTLLSERKALSIMRKPTFCAGCPHNSSTLIPEGSRGYAGIGCHYMVQFIDRNVEGYTHMGGEGVNWVGESRFSNREHVFQNLGDGTYNHSGLMAIRAAVAAGTNITYKLLYNDAVAMTGGQAHEGGMDVQTILNEISGIGVRRIEFVTDDVHRHDGLSLPGDTRITDRSDLQALQRSLAQTPGVSVLVYDQTCAAEKRRRRKRGLHPDPAQRIVINEAVCEGCGDCGVQSNCVAIAPLETRWGRKRQIDQSACNKDYSCVRGFCPSFVTVSGGALKKPMASALDIPEIPRPTLTDLNEPYALMVTGVGGTGIVTIAALIGMAAHLDGLGCGIIDMAGLAQKGGSVVSHVKLASRPEDISAIRIAPGTADCLIGGDLIVSASNPTLEALKNGTARAVINTHEMMPSDFTSMRDLTLPVDEMQSRILGTANPDETHLLNATAFARQWLGDSIGANLFLLGVAWQSGYLPLSFDAIDKAIELNAVAIEFNRRAFALGRLWVYDPIKLSPAQTVAMPVMSVPGVKTTERTTEGSTGGSTNNRSTNSSSTNTSSPKIGSAGTASVREQSLDEILRDCEDFLGDYQSARYAKRYRRTMQAFQDGDTSPDQCLSRTAAYGLFKLMAYKDEYEVARLYANGDFVKKVEEQFEGDYTLSVHLAPPGLSAVSKSTGRPMKKAFGPWVFTAFRALAKMKVLRGTPLDLFGYSAERRREVSLIREYEQFMRSVTEHASGDAQFIDAADALLNTPDSIRGFGPVKEASITRAMDEAQDLLARVRGETETFSVSDGKAA